MAFEVNPFDVAMMKAANGSADDAPSRLMQREMIDGMIAKLDALDGLVAQIDALARENEELCGANRGLNKRLWDCTERAKICEESMNSLSDKLRKAELWRNVFAVGWVLTVAAWFLTR